MTRAILTTHLGTGAVYWIEMLAATGLVDAVILQTVPPRRDAWRRLLNTVRAAVPERAPGEFEYFCKRLPGYEARHHQPWRAHQQIERIAAQAGARLIYDANINSAEVRRFLSESEAGFAFVLGGGIIRAAALSAFRGVWINGHGGLLPYYRGLASEYWAVRNRDLGRIGSTIHELTERIDHGRVIRASTIEVRESDRFAAVCAQSRANLIDLYVQTACGLMDGSIDVAAAKPPEGDGAYYSNPKGTSCAKLCNLTVAEIIDQSL